MIVHQVVTYKDAVERAIIKQHWVVQLESVRVVSPCFH